MSTLSGSSRDGVRDSPNQLTSVVDANSYLSRKRPRPVLSCIECRNKKLKCDRLEPCNQCTRAKRITKCVYQSRELSQPLRHGSGESESEGAPSRKKPRGSQETFPPVEQESPPYQVLIQKASYDGDRGELKELQSRVKKLESILSQNPQYKEQEASLDFSSRPRPSHIEHMESAKLSSANHKGVLSLNGARTRYFGPNHKLALLYRFENAIDFCQRGHPGLGPLMPEIKVFQKRIAAKRKASQNVPILDGSSAFNKLVEMLPPRDICDQLVASYFCNGENSLRIMHFPTFRRECQQFWENKTPKVLPFPGFVPQLCAVMVIGSCWDESKVFAAHLARHGVNEAVISKLIEAWLASLNWKRRIELSTLRTQCLLFMAHQLHSSAPIEAVWNNAGAAVKMAMAMGLHRDPDEFPAVSIFEGEPRRRLWATIVEMDLQASLISGCPSLVREGEYTCSAPKNVDDVQLSEEMTEFPKAKPFHEWTDCVVQVLLAKSFPIRLQAIRIVSNIQSEPDYGKLLELGRKLEDYLDGLPAQVRFDQALSTEPGRLFGQIILDRYIRRTIICLYMPFALAPVDDQSLLEGRKSCIQNSLVILSQQDICDPNVADLKVVKSIVYWDAYYGIARTDIMQAALTVCLEIKALSEASSEEDMTDLSNKNSQLTRQNRLTFQWTKASLTRTVENTLDYLLRRLDDPGTDLRDAMALSMTLQSSRLCGDQETTDLLMIAGANTVLNACRRHFYESTGIGISLDRYPELVLDPTPMPPPDSLREGQGFRPRTGSVNAYNPLAFLSDVDMANGLFDLDFEVDWDWGELWK